MLRTTVVFVTLLPSTLALGGVPKIPARQALPTTATGLSQQVVIPAGHMIAIASNAYFPTLAQLGDDFDAPVIFVYATDNDKLVATIYGGRGTADGAKETMELFRSNYEPGLVAMAKDVFGVELNDSNVTVVYVKRKTKTKSPWGGKETITAEKTILVRANGNYVIP